MSGGGGNLEVPDLEVLLQQVADKNGNQHMAGFLFGQILEYIQDIGMCIFGCIEKDGFRPTGNGLSLLNLGHRAMSPREL